MKKKRILDSEHAMILKRNETSGKNANNNNNIKINAKKAKWKKQSEEFRAALRAGQSGNKMILINFCRLKKPFYLFLYLIQKRFSEII